ncbi:MAG: hypothetical protein E6I76_20670 [Chloroflexi bacterium]|nr:MAG: hypothetical protein E6I76_20670 [Chloroflexota bacterium]
MTRRGRRPGRLLGVDVRRFPSDLATLVRFHDEMTELDQRDAPPALTLDELDEFARRDGSHAVCWR